ncbi:MAG: hypothetical protein ACFCVE_12685 [Phycisphaerae bacterium]
MVKASDVPAGYRKKYTKPKLRKKLKDEIQASDKGGKKGQWSARKAQLLVQTYEKQGGGYKGKKGPKQKHLEKWSAEDWQTKGGDTRARQPDGTTKRYLPKAAWDELSEKEAKKTDKLKREMSKQGIQFVPNSKKARKTGAKVRNIGDLSDVKKGELKTMAKRLGVKGRSKMDKDELAKHVRKAALAQTASKSTSKSAENNASNNADEPTKADLYEQAKRLDIKGRSNMSREELKKAVETSKG